MDKHAHQSLRKRIFRGISKFASTQGKSNERPITGAARDSETPVDHPNVPPRGLSRISQDSGSQAKSSMLTLSVPSSSTRSLTELPIHDSTTDPLPVAPSGGRTVNTNISLAAPLNHVYVITPGAEATSQSKPVQTIKIFSKAFLGLLSSATEGVPVPGVKAIFDTIIKVIGAIEVTQANQEGFKDLESRLETLIRTITTPLRHKKLSEIPDALQAALAELEGDLTKLLTEVDKKLVQGKVPRVINHEYDMTVIKEIDKKISQFLDLYSVRLITHGVMTMLGDREKQAIIRLPRARAGYDHTTDGRSRALCFAGTRDQLLTDIKTWIHEPSTNTPIYVLYGIAGIGKTTVAQTVAQYAADKKLLGASFFFSRTEKDCKSGNHFFTTLAFQLAFQNTTLGTEIAAALLEDPDIHQKSFEVQIRQLLLYPFQKAWAFSPIFNKPVILVVDAIDECLSIHAKTILQLFAMNIQHMPNVKIFITTRPESHIQTIWSSQGMLQPFYLHEIEKSVAKGDIQLFLEHALSEKEISAVLPYSQWEPTQDDMKSLGEKCGILFIMATTAVRYILDEANRPAIQMERLLSGLDIKEEDGVTSSLDKMYLNILRSSVPKRYSAEYLQDFQQVVGTIVVLEDLLPLPALAKLLRMGLSEVQTTLQHLHSIMAPTSDKQAPQLYHTSFPDFITSNERCTDVRFFIVPERQHAQAAQNCFNIMDGALNQNIYGLQGLQKYMTNTEVTEIVDGNKITDELKYACIYWAAHLSKAGDKKTTQLLENFHNFAFKHLLHWIELLSFVGKLDVAYPAMKLAQHALEEWSDPKSLMLTELLYDGLRCVSKYYEIIKAAALHIYYSALPFMPLESQIYKAFSTTVPDCVTVVKGQGKKWSSVLATLKGHSSIVNTIVFSSDGSRLVSGSGDNTAKLWDGFTGAYIATLEGHSATVTSVVFSPDGSRLASGAEDAMVKLWNGFTGVLIATLQDHLSHINTVMFSPDGLRLASSSHDSTIKLWDGFTGIHIATLNDHSSNVKTIAFSPDGCRLASGSWDTTVKLWNGITGDYITTLKGHSGYIFAVTFSPDGSRLASGAGDNTIQLWNVLTGAHIASLVGHTHYVTSVVFSPDGLRLASGSSDTTAKLWDGFTGAHIATLEGHSHYVTSVAFSPDGNRLASGSWDTTIKLWDGRTGAHFITVGSHSSYVFTVAFSADGSRLVSGSGDNTAKLWDGFAGAYDATWEETSDTDVASISFSPDMSKLVSGTEDIATVDGFMGAHIANLNGHSHRVAVAFSLNGSRLVSGPWDSTIELWNGLSGTHIATLEGHLGCVTSIAFSPDGSRVASGSWDSTIKLWDGLTGANIATLEGHQSAVTTVAFSPDGSRLASGGEDNTAKLWDGVTGAHLVSLKGHSSSVDNVMFSPDGSRLISRSYGNAAKVWDVFTGASILMDDVMPQISLPGYVQRPVVSHIDIPRSNKDMHTQGIFSVSPYGIRHTTSNIPIMLFTVEQYGPYVVQSQGILHAMGFYNGTVVILDHSHVLNFI